MNESVDNLIVVLSRNYSTGLSVIRSLGAVGYTVDLVASAYKAGKSEMAAKSKYVRNAVEVVSKKVSDAEDTALLDELLKYAGKYAVKPVLFPTDDYTASVMDKNREVLEECFLMPTTTEGGNGCLTKCMDKTFQTNLAKEAGLLTPAEWIISLKEEIEIPKEMIYPCFCKPIESISGYKKEMAVCRNRRELSRHLRKLQRSFSDRNILVQEFLEIDTEIDFSGVCVDQEVIIPAIIKKTHVAQYEKGVTLAGKVVPFEEIGELKDSIIRMLQSFHYTGMFDMEFNVVGDKVYFNEVNFRSGGPNYSYFASGVNLPNLFVKAIKGESFSEDEKKVSEYGKSFVYEKVAWDDYIHGFMTKKELNTCISEADITLLSNKDDEVPGQVFEKEMKEAYKDYKKKQFKKILKDKKLLIEPFKQTARKIKRVFRRQLRKIKYRVLKYPQVKMENKRRNSLSDKPRVMVVGRDYCSNLSMVRSLGEAGYEVEVLKVFQRKPSFLRIQRHLRPEAYSKYVKAYHVCVANRKKYRIINKLIRIADRNKKMLLIPTDDLVANAVDQYYRKICKYYYVPNMNHKSNEISRLMSKNVQKQFAKEAGLPVLNSCVITAYKGKFKIPASVTYPCFVKPNVSRRSSKSMMKKCEDRGELRAYLRKISARKKVEMLVEDFVEIAQEYAVLGVSAKDAVASPGFFVTEIGGNGVRKGVALKGKVLSCSEEQKLIDRINQFVKSLNYEGLFDVDLIKTTDGVIYFTELNLRFGTSGYAITKSGVNLPGMFADYMLLQKPIDDDRKMEIAGKTFINEKVLYDECFEGFVSKTERENLMKTEDIYFIKNEEDLEPYKHLVKCYNIAPLLHWTDKVIVQKLRMVKAGLRKIKRVLVKSFGRKEKLRKQRRNSASKKPRVMVAGRNYCSNLCMARSLGEAGYEVEVMKIYQVKPRWFRLLKYLKPDAYSKYVKTYHVCVTNRKSLNIIKSLISVADRNRKMLLIPADDLVANAVDQYYNKIRKYYYVPNVSNTPNEINRLMSKDVQKQLAKEANLPILNSCVITAYKGEFEIPESVNYPCFVKPNISKNSSKTKMCKCENEEELRAYFIEASAKKKIEMLVEDFVEIDKEYSILGVCTRKRIASPGFFVAEIGGHGARRGVALKGRVLPCSEEQELIDQINEFITTLNFKGLFDVDLIKTTDGKMYFVELNLRFGASGYAITKSGVNLPGMFADYMLFHKPIDIDCKIKEPGKTFISEKVLYDEWVEGFVTKAERKNLMKSEDIYFIKSEEDAAPYKHFCKCYKFAPLLHWVVEVQAAYKKRKLSNEKK